MKKRTKIWLGLAMILIFAGISLCLAAFAMGLNYKDLSGMAYHGVFHFDEWFDDVQLDSIDVTSDNKSVENTNQADALMIELDYGKLTILSTDRSNAYLEVSTKEDEKYFRFNESNRTIRVYTPDNIIGIHSTDSPEATLYIPENISFEYIEISVEAGSCSIQTALDAHQLHIDVDAGNVSVEKMNADWLEFDCDAGNISFEGQAVSGGTVEVAAGNIDLNINGKEFEDYNYTIEVSVGDLIINDQNFSGIHGNYNIENHAEGIWILNCDLGKIQMNIQS